MRPLELPPWLDWVWQLGTWFPPSPLSWARLRLDGLALAQHSTAAAASSEWSDLDDSWRYERRSPSRLAWQALIDQDIDFTQLVHEPTPGDLRLEERIREHLAPLLKPFEAVKCPPPYLAEPHLEQDPKWCKARQAVFDAIDRLMALPNPLADDMGPDKLLKRWTGDPVTRRQRDVSILAARDLRAQGDVWQSLRCYRKLHTTFGYTVDTFIEEMDAVSEGWWGNTRRVSHWLYFRWSQKFGRCLDEMESFALGVIDVADHRKLSKMQLDGVLDYRPAIEPPGSLFRSCLNWLLVIDHLLLIASVERWSGYPVMDHALHIARCSSPIACHWIWQNSARLEPELKFFLRRRVMLSFQRCNPRCSTGFHKLLACFKLNLDPVQLLYQEQETLEQLRSDLVNLRGNSHARLLQVLDAIFLLQQVKDTRSSAALMNMFAAFLNSVQSTENAHEAESLIFAVLLYDSSATKSLDHHLRQALWASNHWTFWEPHGISHYIARHPLVLEVFAGSRLNRTDPDHHRSRSESGAERHSDHNGVPKGSAGLSTLLDTHLIFTGSPVQWTQSQVRRFWWLWSIWHWEYGPQVWREQTLLCMHVFEHHYLFSLFQHLLRLEDANTETPIYFDDPDEQRTWQDMRASFAPQNCEKGDPLEQARRLSQEWQHLELLAKEIETTLQINSAKPKCQQLPAVGMDALRTVVRSFMADNRTQRSDSLRGEECIFELTTAHHEYLSVPETALDGRPMPGYIYARTRALGVQRRLLRTGSLIGGSFKLRQACLEVEKVSRAALRQRMEEFRSIYWMLQALQKSRPFPGVSSTIYITGREAALEASDAVQALFWQQKGKAEVTAAFIAHRRTRADLVMWSKGDRRIQRALPYLFIQQLERLKQLSSSLSLMPRHDPYSIQHRAPADANLQRDLDLHTLRVMSEQSVLERQPIQCGTAGRRVVLLDWTEDGEYDTLHLAFARFGETPIHEFVHGVAPSSLQIWLERYWTVILSTLKHEDKSCALRGLDRLLEPLLPLASADDVFVICPTGGLHAVPIHALHIEPGVPLLERYPVSYAYNFASYITSVDRSMAPSNTSRTSLREETVIAATYRPIPGGRTQLNFNAVRAGLEASLRDAAVAAGIDFFWDEQVTVKSFADLLQTRRAVLFCGHCLPRSGLLDERLLLSDGELGLQDLLELKLPNSLLIMIACGSAAHSISPADEPLGLPTAALIAGAATVVGTMWPVRVEPAALFIERFLAWLGHADMKTTHGMVDVARAVCTASDS